MNYINNNENKKVDEEIRALTEGPKAKSGFYLSMDDRHDNENESRKINESQCIFFLNCKEISIIAQRVNYFTIFEILKILI
jgi:hypothetical protein